MKFLHVTIQTDKFEEEIAFYEDYVNLKIINDMRSPVRNIVFLSEDESNTKVEIIENENASYSGNENMSIGFNAEDLDALYETFKVDGFDPSPMSEPAPGVRYFFVKDPAGVKVQFM